ncbi:MAG: M20/M25/M40 family metallo-hydrolase [Phycisphaerae bacterium]|nr:M20/M25/M40 family metallo-hydrolase [Phycisphaerae bacterium]
MNAQHLRILKDLLSLPTAPFAEHRIIDYVRAFCRERTGVRFTQDRFGNVLLRLGRARRRPLVLAAHMDHPGFIAERMIGKELVRAAWHGGVEPAYFIGAKVRFFSGSQPVRGEVVRIQTAVIPGPAQRRERVTRADIRVAREVKTGAVGMWNFPDTAIRGHRIRARGCDDIAGVAAALACVDELVRRHGSPNLCVLLTRAEEVGFAGAIAAANDRSLPADAIIVAIECSAERPHVRMGSGPILRVGDHTSVFTPAATAWCRTIAETVATTDSTFTFQRALMDGGTCESSVYCEFGYAATGVCIALGNYHNMAASRRRLTPETVDLRDWTNMVRWFVAMATTETRYDGTQPGLRRRLRNLGRRYHAALKATARTPGRVSHPEPTR